MSEDKKTKVLPFPTKALTVFGIGSLLLIGACLYLAFSPRIISNATQMLPATITLASPAVTIQFDTDLSVYRHGERYRPISTSQTKELHHKISQLDQWLALCDSKLFDSPSAADLTLEIENHERILTYRFSRSVDHSFGVTTINQLKTAMPTPRTRSYRCESLPSWLSQYSKVAITN